MVPAIVDVQGYFYPKELSHTITVSPAGGDFATPQEALAALADLVAANDPDQPSAANPYLIQIGPGVYDLGSTRLQLLAGVTLEGAGRGATVLRGLGGANAAQAVVRGATGASLRRLTIESSGPATYAVALFNTAAAPTLEDVALIASGASNNFALRNDGVGASPLLDGVDLYAADGANVALRNSNGAAPILSDVVLTATAGSQNRAVHNLSAASATLYHSTATGTLLNDASSALWFANGVLDGAASGGGFTCAFVVDGAFKPLDGACLP
jgi:hypothetical protein